MTALYLRIVKACDAAGISVSAFGKYVGNDGQLVPQIRRGRNPQGALRERIERAINLDKHALHAAATKATAKERQATNVGRVVRMLETGQRNGTIGGNDDERLPRNPDVPFLGGAYLAAENMVMLVAHGGNLMLPPDDAALLGQRLLALAAKVRAA